MLDSFLQDLRFGARMLVKAPAFTLVAILTLALGIGANSAIFSIMNALLMRTLPVYHPEELVVLGNPERVHSLSTGSPRTDTFSYPLFKELVAGNEVFSGMVATGDMRRLRVLAASDDPGKEGEPARARAVSGNYFSVLGVSAFQGRTFTAAEDSAPGADPYAVISYAFWTRRFHRDPGVVGSVLRVNGYPLTVVGIAPPGYLGEVVGDSIDLWVPLMMQAQVMPGYKFLDDANASWLLVIARLKPGITLAQAQASVKLEYQRIASSSFASRFDADNQKELKDHSIRVSEGAHGVSSLRAQFTRPLQLLMAIVGLVLLIACVNVANLLLARASGRQTEMAVRLAIGASPWRLGRQLLTESVLLGFVGGLCGLLASIWGAKSLVRLVAGSNRGAPLDTTPDLRVLAFTVVVSLLTGILFGLAPALRAAHMPLTATLKSGGRSASAAAPRASLGKLLVGGQVALSVLVIFTAGLLVSSLKKLENVDTGYQRDSILIVRVDWAGGGYVGSDRYFTASNDLLDRLRRLPGATAATFSENGLFSGTESADGIVVEGFIPSSDKDKVAYDDTVGPGYFTALSIPLLLGRDFGPQDTPNSPRVMIINEAMSKFYFKGANPLGRKIAIDDPKLRDKPYEVIGVAHDVRDHRLESPAERRFYMPVTQGMYQPPAMNYELRSSGNPAALADSVRSTVRAFDANLPIMGVQTVDNLIEDTLTDQIMVAKLSTLFAALALLLACVGLYGLMSYTVAGRTREIGVRMALGATRADLLWLIVREAMIMVVIGIGVGLPVAMAASRALHSMLFEVTALNPVPLAASTLLLGAVAALAAWIPARRATRVDPMVALRYE